MGRGAAAMALVVTEREKAVAEQALGGKGCRRALGKRAAEMAVVVAAMVVVRMEATKGREVEAMWWGAAAMALVVTEREKAVAEQALGGKGCQRALWERAAEMAVVVVLTAAEVEEMGQAAVAMVLAAEVEGGRAVAMGWGAEEMG